jgi:hypothetical protein
MDLVCGFVGCCHGCSTTCIEWQHGFNHLLGYRGGQEPYYLFAHFAAQVRGNQKMSILVGGIAGLQESPGVT